MIRLASHIALVAAALVMATSLQAETLPRCAVRGVIVNDLLELYGETLQAFGITSSGTLVETFASDETGTWTITITSSTGLTCVASTGEMFEIIPAGEAL